jgi:hypothetical protein
MSWKFAGRFFSSLDEAVDSAVEQAHARVGDEVMMGHMLERDPVEILKGARWRLIFHADLEAGDVAAVERLGSILDCYLTGLSELCDCGRMEGEHSKFTDACPEVAGYFISKRLVDSLNGFPDYHTSRAYRMGE